MKTITTKDGVTIYYKDWGSGQPIVFSHGWPLSSDDWDAQMLFFLNQGFRVIATIAAGTVVPLRCPRDTIWITTLMISQH